MLPEQARLWAEAALGQPIIRSERLRGGLTQTIFGIEAADGSRMILRHLPQRIRGVAGRLHAASEAQACTVLADVDLPSPRLIAADLDGSAAGGPSTLTTWLPGRVRLTTHSAAAIAALAHTAVRIHAVEVDPSERPRPFDPWLPDRLEVPTWAEEPELWRRALAIHRQGPPDTPFTLVHRDFHPGNILWQADAITGVIDWAESSWGPADLDVAHCSANFALLHNPQSAAAFRTAYLAAGGRLDPDRRARVYWAVLDILSFLPDPAPILEALRQSRPDLSADLVRRRIEALLRTELLLYDRSPGHTHLFG